MVIKKNRNTVEILYPNFLYIGAAKAGSSWIYEILRAHPEVFVPAAKDLQFFDKNYTRGIDWYLSFFTPRSGEKTVGEISHDYFLAEENARKIHHHLPNVRLMCCLREPVEMLFSAYLYLKTITLAQDMTFADFVLDKKVLTYCDYYYNLYPFYERFPREKILSLFFDDLKTDPLHFTRRIYEFLGVDPGFQPEVLSQKVLPASEPKVFWLAHLAYRTGLIFRQFGLPGIVGRVKRNELFRRMFYKKLDRKPEIPEDVKLQLKIFYSERYKQLPQLIGQPLPEGWFRE
ncbi:MAG: sulfotransferase domain-containing protein [Deltaproteobacteria bacterium]|nr:sulfotransferase domain-containing protein [Deltaproteobacteria bacterium]